MTTRRDFLQRAGAGAIVYKLAGARPQLKAASKNDQIGLGFIGVGIRGTYLLQGFQAISGVRPVIAADVYAFAPHTGRGGWTWYTGSAGWMYRLVVESLLGLRLEMDRLHFAPCLPAEWKEFKLHYRYRETYYHITMRRPETESDEEIDASSVTIDGVTQDGTFIVLVDDRREHRVEVQVHSRDSVSSLLHTRQPV